jgi:transcriptional regulator NrdR family protein
VKCPKCGAVSLVLATREHKGVLLRRSRKCFNDHTFQTYEVFTGNLDRRTLVSTARGIETRARAWRIKLAVQRADACESAIVLAMRLGITEARVRQIRKAL